MGGAWQGGHVCGRGLRGEVPEAQGAVPGARERELPVGGDDDVADEVGVAPQRPLGDAVVGLVPCQLPHDDGFVWGGRRERGETAGNGAEMGDRGWKLGKGRRKHGKA